MGRTILKDKSLNFFYSSLIDMDNQKLEEFNRDTSDSARAIREVYESHQIGKWFQEIWPIKMITVFWITFL